MTYLFKTPFGWCGISAREDIVTKIVLPSHNKPLVLKRLNKSAGAFKNNLRRMPALTRLLKYLRRYFNGEKVDFWGTKILIPFPSRIPSGRGRIDLRDYSNFEQAVYKTLATIPYGQVRSYQWVANNAGYPKASRAVGNALAKNPLPVILPCHRVIKSDGSLGNFSAIGGTKLKKKLLKLERAL